MAKRIVMTIFLLALIMWVGRIVGDSFQVVVSDRVAVEQVEDDDAASIAAQNVQGVYTKAIPFVVMVLCLGTCWIVWREPIKKALQGTKEV